MSDIKTAWNVQAGEGDWALIPGDLQGGDDLETAVLISLFSDRRAEDSDVVPDARPGQPIDWRGWWADLGQDYPVGSRMWLLARAKRLPDVLQTAQGYCTEALAWMVADGVAAKVAADCSFVGQDALGIVVTLYRQDGSVLATYAWAWKGLN